MIKSSKQKNMIVIILLVIIFTGQYFLLYKYTAARTVLDPKVDVFNNEVAYKILKKSTDHLLTGVDLENKAITLLFNDQTNKYSEYGIGYLYLRLDLLPVNMPSVPQFFYPINDSEFINTILETEEIDYVLFLGIDTEIYNEKTTSDFTLFKVIDRDNNIVEKVDEMDFSLYGLYEKCDNNECKKEVFDLADYFKKVIKQHFNIPAIIFMNDFANDLYLHQEYDLAIEYSNYYLEEVDYINDKINMNMGNIYEKRNDIDKAIHYYSNCMKNEVCNTVDVKEKIDHLEMKRGE